MKKQDEDFMIFSLNPISISEASYVNPAHASFLPIVI